MTRGRIAPARIFPRDVELLERRARELAAGAAATEEAGGARRVLFSILGSPCALDAAAVTRAVARLAGVAPVSMADGGERTVAFVEERPLPVADLSGAAAGAERHADELAGACALVLATPAGEVAVAVEGPLDLREERLAAATTGGRAEALEGLRLAGRLADGTAVLDAEWLLSWAAKAARG
ncbi:MAG TPA: hypothetical protein VLT47_03900 [Anaeromyxobacteraceae bacterium]|nr:hypothetical protein [Anaeromyxobacteraceae bacterium]